MKYSLIERNCNLNNIISPTGTKRKSAKVTWKCMQCFYRWQCSFTFYSMCRCLLMRNERNSRKCNPFHRLFIGHRYFCLMQQFISCIRTLCIPYIFGLIRTMSSKIMNIVRFSRNAYCKHWNISKLIICFSFTILVMFGAIYLLYGLAYLPIIYMISQMFCTMSSIYSFLTYLFVIFCKYWASLPF